MVEHSVSPEKVVNTMALFGLSRSRGIKAIIYCNVKRKLIQRPRLMIKAARFWISSSVCYIAKDHTYQPAPSQESAQADFPAQSMPMDVNSINPLMHLTDLPFYQRLPAELLYRSSPLTPSHLSPTSPPCGPISTDSSSPARPSSASST